MDAGRPLRRIYDLGDLSNAGYETTVTASVVELNSIAAWEGVDAVVRFEGQVTLERLSATRFAYQALLSADVLQSCVVTLEPIGTQISRRFSRELHYIPARFDEKGGAVTLGYAEDDTPDEIDSLKFDLAAPLLEEFSLAVDPFPRAGGAEFRPPHDETVEADNPFAVLKGLKRG